MKPLLRLAVFSILVLCCVTPGSVQAITNQSIAVPLYEQPGKNSFWDDIRGAGSASVSFVVANPANGPGGATSPAYVSALAKNDSAGVRTLGYVQTNYQARPFKETYNDIDAWYRLYPNIRGVLIGLIKEGGPDEVCYVASLYSHVKNIRPNDLVVLGAGTHISPAYEPYGDIFLNAESDYASYQSAWKTQYRGFEDKADYQNRFWHILHGVRSEQYSSAFDAVRSNNAGWVYITDKTLPNPYNATPSYWQNEANDVGALPASSIPNRGKTSLPRGCISLSASADNTIDTTAVKQSSTKSTVTANNTSQGYDSEPVTTLQFVNVPKGASLTSMSGEGWSCNAGAKVCTYGATLTASSSASKVATSVQAGCDYVGGDAKLRLTNYAGNRWDVKIPLRAPVGCDASTAAGKISADKSGQIIALTTQSIETTPAIAPLGSKDEVIVAPGKEAVKGSLSSLKVLGIITGGLVLLGGAAWGGWTWYKRNRYRTRM